MERVDIAVVDGDDFVKDHGGHDGVERAAVSALAMGAARDAGLPVPAVRHLSGPVLRQEYVDGARNGVGLLERDPVRLLGQLGEFAARLHAVAPPDGLPVTALEGVDPVWVHGDLCPINALVDHDSDVLVAVVDWESSRVADPVIDLAWSEWLVRSFHASRSDAIPALYDGYGWTPDAVRRRRAMAECLAHHRRRAHAEDERRLWTLRLELLGDLDLTL